MALIFQYFEFNAKDKCNFWIEFDKKKTVAEQESKIRTLRW